MLTAAQAAERVGKKKNTIIKAIKSGRMSAQKDGNGQWSIDPAELFRVYPANSNGDTEGIHGDTGDTPAVMRVKLDAAEDKIELLQAQLQDLKEDRDKWRTQATGLLIEGRKSQDSLFDRFAARWRKSA